MNKWTFNYQLFSRLSDVLDISSTEISKRCGVKQQVLNRYMRNETVLPVQILIKMCNALRMPSYFFVSEDNNYDMPNREIATISLDNWQPIDWNYQEVENTFGDGGNRIFWKDVAKVMDVTPQKPHARFLLEKRFCIDDFLNVCSHFDISPFNFLIDPNRKQDNKSRKTAAMSGTRDGANMLGEIRILRQQIADLASTVDGVANDYKEISDKYDDLMEAHKALLRRFNEHIEERYIGMAAEPEVKQK